MIFIFSKYTVIQSLVFQILYWLFKTGGEASPLCKGSAIMFIYKAATAAKYLSEMILLPECKSEICFHSDIVGGYAKQ